MKTWVDLIHSSFVSLGTNAGLQLGLLAMITLLAAVLRLYKLGDWSFWIDEVLYLNFSSNIFNHTYMRWPISGLLIHLATMTLGTNEWSARLSPALIGIASIPILFFPLKKLLNSVTALIALTLLAISPWHLYWSQTVRFYSALLLLFTLALFAFYFGIEKDRPILILLAMVLFFLAFRERGQVLLLIPVIITYILLLLILRIDIPPGVRLRNIILVSSPIAAYCAFYDPSFLSLLYNPYFGLPNHGPFRFFASVVYWIGIPLVCLGFVGSIDIILKKDRRGLVFVVGAWIPLILLLLTSTFTFTVDRYIFLSLPCWVTLGAIAVKDLFSQAKNRNLILLSGVLLILFIEPLSRDYLYFDQQNGGRLDWRQAFEIVRMEKKKGDLVYTTWPELGQYYLNEDVFWINDFEEEEPANERIWFVTEESIDSASPNPIKWIKENSALVNILPLTFPGKNIQIRISLFTPASQ